jgi:PAS domain S-box-containing protein
MSPAAAAKDQATASDSFAGHCERLVAASTSTAGAVVFAVTALYALSQWLARPAQLRGALVFYLVQLAAPLLAWGLTRTRLRHHAQLVVLGADLLYTACLTGQLFVRETSTSGALVFVCLKLMATALFFPWSARIQCISAGATVTLYWLCLIATGRPHDEVPRLHHYAGPAVAALLAVAGAARGDQVRRKLFQDDCEREELLARLQLVLDRMPIGCMLNDADLRFTYWNPVAERIFGYRLEEVLGKHPFDVITPMSTAQPSHRRLRQLVTSGTVGPVQSRNLTKDGRLLICEWNSAPLRRRDGTFVGLLVMAQDVTARQRDAEEKQILFDELRAANRLKSDFVATMSHELRTPLNVILGYHDLLQDGAFGALGEEQSAVLSRMRQSAEELLELINATLDVSRLEAGHVEVEKRSFRLSDLAAQVDAETRELHKPAVRVEWQVASELPEVCSDPGKVKIILKNLFTNALKFTDAGSVVVRGVARDTDAELQVTDTGMGIAPETLPMIFEPFRQMGDVATGNRGGVGLGLYIVRRLVDMLGADLSVESTPGQGTTFRLRVPLAAVATASAVESQVNVTRP